jgi:hypothetical protein
MIELKNYCHKSDHSVMFLMVKYCAAKKTLTGSENKKNFNLSFYTKRHREDWFVPITLFHFPLQNYLQLDRS